MATAAGAACHFATMLVVVAAAAASLLGYPAAAVAAAVDVVDTAVRAVVTSPAMEAAARC